MLFRKRKRSIDLEKGKLLYYQYYGSKFDMWHDLNDEYENCNVPEEIEIEWRKDILKNLMKEIETAQGLDLQISVSRYMHLLPADSEYLILLIQSKNVDTFTATIFLEDLKDRMTHTKDNGKAVYIRSFLDEYKLKLLNAPVTIHESYKTEKLMRDYDFSEDNIKARIEAI